MPQPIQEYTRRYWASHIRPIFMAEWEEKRERLRLEGKPVPEATGVEERNAIVRRFWEQEMTELQEAIKSDVTEEHKEALKEYKEKMNTVPKMGKMYTW